MFYAFVFHVSYAFMLLMSPPFFTPLSELLSSSSHWELFTYSTSVSWLFSRNASEHVFYDSDSDSVRDHSPPWIIGPRIHTYIHSHLSHRFRHPPLTSKVSSYTYAFLPTPLCSLVLSMVVYVLHRCSDSEERFGRTYVFGLLGS